MRKIAAVTVFLFFLTCSGIIAQAGKVGDGISSRINHGLPRSVWHVTLGKTLRQLKGGFPTEWSYGHDASNNDVYVSDDGSFSIKNLPGSKTFDSIDVEVTPTTKRVIRIDATFGTDYDQLSLADIVNAKTKQFGQTVILAGDNSACKSLYPYEQVSQCAIWEDAHTKVVIAEFASTTEALQGIAGDHVHKSMIIFDKHSAAKKEQHQIDEGKKKQAQHEKDRLLNNIGEEGN